MHEEVFTEKKRLALKETGKSYTSTHSLFIQRLLDGWKIGVEDTFPVSDIKRCVDVNTDRCFV
jgi:hypothetical protein